MRIIAAAALAAALTLAGCSGSSDSSDGPSPDASRTFDRDQVKEQAEDQADADAKAQEQAGGAVVDIVVRDGKVTPQGSRVDVKVGQKVFLNIVSDADEEIHVHSEPEHEYEVSAGAATTESFTLDTPGQVAVEAHHLDVTIVQLVVRP